MGFFGRLATLIKSNLNDLISKSEDPEKMLNQVIVDMNQQLVEAKKQVAVAIADEKRLQKQYNNEKAVLDEWHKKAMLAVRAGDDELAKEALLRKKEHDNLAKAFEDQWRKQQIAVNQLKTALRALNNKIEEAKRKKNLLLARQRRAQAQKRISETMSGLSEKSAFEAFARMEEKIEQNERMIKASSEIDEEFSGDRLQRDFKLLEKSSTSMGADAQLLALKQKMGLLPSAPPAEKRQLGAGNVPVEETVHAEFEESEQKPNG